MTNVRFMRVIETTCYTIISRDVKLLAWMIENARERAGMDHEWLVVNWINEGKEEESHAILQWIEDQNKQGFKIRSVPHIAKAQGDESRTEWFLRNLYACWNLGYSAAETDNVCRMGSDQFFSKNWLLHLAEGQNTYGNEHVYHVWTVESDLAQNSRHDVRAWGHIPSDFDHIRFDAYCDDLIHRYSAYKGIEGPMCGLYYKHPARGQQRRPDGVTWLQTKKLWEEFGPISDELNEEGVTGDVSYMDKIYDAGRMGYLCPRSVSYHLVRGESREIQE